jgi:2-polyprenyl-6-methoxyphenol hydroxylase-like FAD-dependent oxidoreductase
MRGGRVAVVGGSIGGCSAALAAARGGADEVVIFERSPGELRDRGAGIAIHHDRFAELAVAGFIDESVPACRADTRLWYARDDSAPHGVQGKPIGANPFPFSGYNWGHLWRFVRGRLPANVTYRSGTRVDSVEPAADGVTVRMADGTADRFDLVIGADGYRSAVRRAMFPDSGPEYAGYLCWRGLVDTAELAELAVAGDPDTVLPESAFFTVGFPGRAPAGGPAKGVEATGHLVLYRIPADGESGNGRGNGSDAGGPAREALNWVLFSTVPPHLDLGLAEPTSLPPGAVADHLLDHMEALIADHLPPYWAAALRLTPREEVFIQPMYDLEAPSYGAGRLLLLGDSGAVSRPHAAAGTLKALQDAVALQEAWDAAADWSDLVERYDGARRAAGHAVVALARRIGRGQVLDVPDWAAFETATLLPWITELTRAPDGTVMGGRELGRR